MGASSTGNAKLYKYQWSQMQNPPAVWGIVESGDDAELLALPPIAGKDENGVLQSAVTQALLYEMRLSCKRGDLNKPYTKNNESLTICKSGDDRYYFYRQDDFWRVNGIYYWENGLNSKQFYKYENGKYVGVQIPEGQYTLALLADEIRDLFFIKTPLILLSAGTSGTVTEFAIDQISGVLLDKLQADGAINVETNLLASLVLGAVGSQSMDADQLKAMIEQVKTLAKKAKPGDLKQLVSDVVEQWKVGAKKGVQGAGNLAWIDDLASVLPLGAKTKITTWIDGGLDAEKLKATFSTFTDKTVLYNKLNLSKGINHQKAIIDDYINIPGVTKGSFVGNAVDNVTSNILKTADSKQFIMYPGQAKTFVKNASLSVRNSIDVIEDLGNGIQFIKIKPGTKVYRVFDGYKPWDDISMTGNTLPNGSF
jgi:hypothetical protein